MSDDVAESPRQGDVLWLLEIEELKRVARCAVAEAIAARRWIPTANHAGNSQSVHHQEQVIGVLLGVKMPRPETVTIKHRTYT